MTQKNHNFIIGPTDTDSISFCKGDGTNFTPEEQKDLLKELNEISPEFMIWEDDGFYDTAIALKAKNYLLYDKKKDKKIIKGSAFKTSSKEPILRQLMDDMIQAILDEKSDTLPFIYERYCQLARTIKDIKPWCQKKTITKSVLKCKGHETLSTEEKKANGIRKNETDVWDAIKNTHFQEGDKAYVWPCVVKDEITQQPIMRKNKTTGLKEVTGYKPKRIITTGLALAENFNQDKICLDKMLKRCYDTVVIFKNIINMDDFKYYDE